MTPTELIPILADQGPGRDTRTALLELQVLLKRLAVHAAEARLANGRRISDQSDLQEWLLELAEQANQELQAR
jgi:hypothetical protein